MDYKLLNLTRNEQAIATMTLNRPDRLNSYTPELEKEMRMATEEIPVDSSIRALVITGSGRAFSAG